VSRTARRPDRPAITSSNAAAHTLEAIARGRRQVSLGAVLLAPRAHLAGPADPERFPTCGAKREGGT
jgi:hypothetical protein